MPGSAAPAGGLEQWLGAWVEEDVPLPTTSELRFEVQEPSLLPSNFLGSSSSAPHAKDHLNSAPFCPPTC